MKRYLAFWFEGYSEMGGLNDAFKSFDEKEEAITAVQFKRDEYKYSGATCGYVFDLNERIVVWSLDDEIIDIEDL